MAAANLPVTIRNANGRRRTISLFELAIRQLATGQTSRRRSPTPFIRLVIACAGEVVHTPSAAPAQERQPPIDPAFVKAKLHLDAALAAGSDAAKEAALSDVLSRIRALARHSRG